MIFHGADSRSAKSAPGVPMLQSQVLKNLRSSCWKLCPCNQPRKMCSISPCYLWVGDNCNWSEGSQLDFISADYFLGKTCDDETSYIYSIVPNKVQNDNRIFFGSLTFYIPPDCLTNYTQTLPLIFPISKTTRNSVWLILCCRRKGPPQRPPCPSSSSIHSSQRRGATCNSCSLVNSAGRGRLGTAGDARCIAKLPQPPTGGNSVKLSQDLPKIRHFAMVMWNMYEMTHHHWWGGSFEGGGQRPCDSNDSMVRINAFNFIYCILVSLASQNYSTSSRGWS